MCLWQHKEKAQYRTTEAHPKLRADQRASKQRHGPESYFCSIPRPKSFDDLADSFYSIFRIGVELRAGELLLHHPCLDGLAHLELKNYLLLLSRFLDPNRRARFERKKESYFQLLSPFCRVNKNIRRNPFSVSSCCPPPTVAF